MTQPHAVSKRLRSKDTNRLRARAGEQVLAANSSWKSRGAPRIGDKTDFTPKTSTRDKEVHPMFIKGSIDQKHLTHTGAKYQSPPNHKDLVIMNNKNS